MKLTLATLLFLPIHWENAEPLVHGQFIIYKDSNDKFDIYLKNQEDESDSDPKFTGTASEVIQFINQYS